MSFLRVAKRLRGVFHRLFRVLVRGAVVSLFVRQSRAMGVRGEIVKFNRSLVPVVSA